ncbi:7TM chemoreceptor, partial [Trichostrongylus colubriformis]
TCSRKVKNFITLSYAKSVPEFQKSVNLFVDYRILLSSSVTALIPVGPCRLLGVMPCFVAYNIMVALNLNVQMSTLLSMYFRYRLIQTNGMTAAQLRASFIISVTLPTTFIIAIHIGPRRFDLVMREAIREHSEHNITMHGNFGGYESTSNLISSIYAFISLTTALISPILILYWKSIILKKLQLNENMHSETTKRGSRVFLKALTSQAIVQLLSYVPVSALYLIKKYSDTDLIILENGLVAIMTAPCAIDPICSIYFIPPYRKWTCNQFQRYILCNQRSDSNPPTSTVNVSSSAVFAPSFKRRKTNG